MNGPLSPTLSGEPLDVLAGDSIRLPLVSVIIINHNYSAYVGQAISSIKQQDYPRIEIVVVDNASTDNSREVIEKHLEGDPRCSAIFSDHNDGPLGAAVKGIEATTGEFVGFFDADDCLLNKFISYHVQAHLAGKREVAFTASNVLQIGRNGALISGGRWGAQKARSSRLRGMHPSHLVPILPTIRPDEYQTLSKSVVTLPATERGWLWFGSSANLFRRDALDLVRAHDPALLTMGDDGFFLSADSYFTYNCHWIGGSILIEMPLHVYRMHGENQFNRGLRFRGVRRPDSPVQDFLPRRYVEMLRDVVARHEHLLSITSPERFWGIFDQAYGRLDPRLDDEVSPEAFAALAEAFPKLAATFGADQAVEEFRKQVGLRCLSRIITAAYRWRVPISVLWSFFKQARK